MSLVYRQEEWVLTNDVESLLFFTPAFVNTTKVLQKHVPSTQGTYHILYSAILRIEN